MLLLVERIYHLLPFFKGLILSIVSVKSLSWAFFFFFSFSLLPSFLPPSPFLSFFFFLSFPFLNIVTAMYLIPIRITERFQNPLLTPETSNRSPLVTMSLTLRPDFGSRAGDKGEASPFCWSIRTFSWYSPTSSSLPCAPPAGSRAVSRGYSVSECGPCCGPRTDSVAGLMMSLAT